MSRAEMQAKYAAKELAALDNKIMSGKGKKQLLALLRMEQLAAEEITHIRGFSATVDHKGIIVFFLPGGGRILDSGKELFFSNKNASIRHVALRYAQKNGGTVCG